jgi:hypothetical protein
MAQASTRKVKISTILNNRYFTKGVQDALAGRSFDPDYDKWEVVSHGPARWCYERGRQYGIATGGKIPTKTGKRLNINAIAEFARLYREGVIL